MGEGAVNDIRNQEAYRVTKEQFDTVLGIVFFVVLAAVFLIGLALHCGH